MVAAFLLLSAALLFGQSDTESSFASEEQTGFSNPDLSAYIAPDLDPAEWAFVHTYMNSFSPDAKNRILNTSPENVSVAIVDGSTGKIHYNRREDEGSLEVRAGFALPGDEHPSREREQLAGAPTPGGNPGVFGGSGPYRRVYTTPVIPIPVPAGPHPGIDASWGNYSQSGWVTTSCNAGKFVTGDVGYIYLGGWSGTWDTLKGTLGNGSVIDAGLQYSPLKNDYAMFMAIGGGSHPIGIITKGNQSDAKQPTRIACGALTHLFFTVDSTVLAPHAPSSCLDNGTEKVFFGPSPACTTYALQLEANSAHVEGRIGKVVEQFILWIAPTVDTGGWSHAYKFVGDWNGKHNQTLYASKAQCANCMFKWMTSIGQKKENLASGSTFTATWSSRQITDWAFGGKDANGQKMVALAPGITDCSEYPLWHSPYGKPYNADCKNSPSALKGLSQTVKVTGYTSGGETDSIALKY